MPAGSKTKQKKVAPKVAKSNLKVSGTFSTRLRHTKLSCIGVHDTTSMITS